MNPLNIVFYFLLNLLISSTCCYAFTIYSPSKGGAKAGVVIGNQNSFAVPASPYAPISLRPVDSSLRMASDNEGPGALTSIGILTIMLLFVGTGLLPLLDGGGKDLSIADSVVTRQDAPQKLQNFESSQDRLSRATIQEKLSAIPVFYLSEGGNMQTDVYLSYAEAADAASSKGSVSVKATSLDQVM